MGPQMLTVLDTQDTRVTRKISHLTLATPTLKYAAESLKGLDSNDAFKVISSKNFDDLINEAKNKPRKRKMIDLTKDPKANKLQTLMNTWTEGSYSPVHKHSDYSEVHIILSI